MRNERTSKRVAKIAGRILGSRPRCEVVIYPKDSDKCEFMKWSDIRALAASALTQTADRKPVRQLIARVDKAYKAAKRKRRARRK